MGRGEPAELGRGVKGVGCRLCRNCDYTHASNRLEGSSVLAGGNWGVGSVLGPDGSSWGGAAIGSPYTLNPELEILNPTPENLNPTPET